MPRVVGIVDGTHLECVRPANALDGPYISRKGYPSINAMGVCDHRKRFIAFLANFPGSCHDSHVVRYAALPAALHDYLPCRNSQFWNAMEAGRVHGIILGDSGYAQSSWLFTPVRIPRDNAEKRYNVAHRRTRCWIEHAFGILKMRWRVLHSECRLQPRKVRRPT